MVLRIIERIYWSDFDQIPYVFAFTATEIGISLLIMIIFKMGYCSNNYYFLIIGIPLYILVFGVEIFGCHPDNREENFNNDNNNNNLKLDRFKPTSLKFLSLLRWIFIIVCIFFILFTIADFYQYLLWEDYRNKWGSQKKKNKIENNDENISIQNNTV